MKTALRNPRFSPTGAVLLLRALLFLTLFGFYLRTMPPDLVLDDSGEMTASAAAFSVPHPSGFPLWILLARWGLTVPLGTPAFRLGLLSALLASLCAVILAALAERWIRRMGVGAGAAGVIAVGTVGVWAVSPILWPQAQTAKGGLYILQALIGAAFLSADFDRRDADVSGESSRERRARLRMVFWGALGLTNHWGFQLCLFLPWVFEFSGSVHRRGVTLRNGCWVAVLSILGLSLYLTSVLAGRDAQLVSISVPSHWDGFWKMASRAYYRLDEGHLRSALAAGDPKGWETAFRQWRYFGEVTLKGWMALWPWALLGLAIASRKGGAGRTWPAAAAALAWIAVGVSTEIPRGAEWQFDKFMIPLSIVAPLCAAGGVAWLTRIAMKRERSVRLGVLALVTASVVGSVFQTVSRWGYLDRGRVTASPDYAQMVCRTLPRNALFLPETDQDLNAFWYMRHARGRRTDVECQNLFSFSIREIVDKTFKRKGWPHPSSDSNSESRQAMASRSLTFWVEQEWGQRPLAVSFSHPHFDRLFLGRPLSWQVRGPLALSSPTAFSRSRGVPTALGRWMDRPETLYHPHDGQLLALLDGNLPGK